MARRLQSAIQPPRDSASAGSFGNAWWKRAKPRWAEGARLWDVRGEPNCIWVLKPSPSSFSSLLSLTAWGSYSKCGRCS